MIELHHDAPSANSLKILIALVEKGLRFTGHRVDTADLGQWSEAHRALAPRGQVPVLIDDGEVMNEAGYALQYLAEAYPTPRLAPTDPAGWYDIQASISQSDAALAANVALLGWTATTTPEAREEYRRKLAQVPGRERPAGWSAVVADVEASEDQLALARERIADAVAKLEARLGATGWIVGSDYSIADINGFALLRTLPRLAPDLVDGARAPRVREWLERIAERPAVAEALSLCRLPEGGDAYTPPT